MIAGAAGLFWLTPDVRALAVKDLQMFWRDTTQWGQSVMFFGLLAVYIINLRNFTHQLTSPFWINTVAFLNLGACAFNLASLTTRFVFPQFSLEGRRMWIIGLAPMGLERVVTTKFWLASTMSVAISGPRTTFSAAAGTGRTAGRCRTAPMALASSASPRGKKLSRLYTCLTMSAALANLSSTKISLSKAPDLVKWSSLKTLPPWSWAVSSTIFTRI